MRQQGMGTISAILAIVIAGLIVYGIIFYVGGSGALSPSEVREHPNKYLDKEITIEGYYSLSLGPLGFSNTTVRIIADEYPTEWIPSKVVGVEISDIENVTLIDGGKYRFTGVLKQTELVVPELDWVSSALELTLVASQAEPI